MSVICHDACRVIVTRDIDYRPSSLCNGVDELGVGTELPVNPSGTQGARVGDVVLVPEPAYPHTSGILGESQEAVEFRHFELQPQWNSLHN